MASSPPVQPEVLSEKAPASRVAHDVLFGQLAELSDAGVVFLNEKQEIEFISQRARKVLGCAGEKEPASCWQPVQDVFAEAVERDAIDERQREVSFTRDGSLHDVVLEVHAVDEEPCTGYLVLLKDRAAVDQLKKDLQLASQFRNTGRLYRAVAHNLRHPVSTILIRIDLLQNMIDGDEPADPDLKTRSLKAIKEEIQELDNTLRLLLEDFSPAGEAEQTFDLRKVMTDLVHLVEPQARQQDVRLDVELPGEELIVSGQRTQLKQAIMNLAVNALEALPTGGKLRLALTDGGDETVHIEVSDDGPGIPDDVRKHIFESHYTTKEDGTGIGLHLVRETVEHHGGALDLETAPGDGCTFRLQLPAHKG